MEELAKFLQKEGHAVLVPSLRGHGNSVNVQGSGRKLLASTLNPAQFQLMVKQDMEACKAYLMAKNNAGDLNIEKLCVVGAEMGAIVAMNWAVEDWHWPVLTTGKQGQDVKALVLLSPPMAFHGIKACRVPGEVSVLVLWGDKKARSVPGRQAGG